MAEEHTETEAERFTREGEDPTGHEPGADAGGRAHTTPEEGHPAGEGERSDREVGGPKTGDD